MSRAAQRLERPYQRIEDVREQDRENQRNSSIVTTTLSSNTLITSPDTNTIYISNSNDTDVWTTVENYSSTFTFTTTTITIDEYRNFSVPEYTPSTGTIEEDLPDEDF